MFYKKKERKTYNDAKKWVQKHLVPLGIDSERQWKRYLKGDYKNAPTLPLSIPRAIVAHYKSTNEWVSFMDFFNTDHTFFNHKNPTNQQWRSYEETRKWVFENLVPHGIDSTIKWKMYLNGEYKEAPLLPIDIPKFPLDYFRKQQPGVNSDNFFSKERQLINKSRYSLIPVGSLNEGDNLLNLGEVVEITKVLDLFMVKTSKSERIFEIQYDENETLFISK